MLTADAIYFGKIDTDKLIDHIPISEIEHVEPLHEPERKIRSDNKSAEILSIRTIRESAAKKQLEKQTSNDQRTNPSSAGSFRMLQRTGSTSLAELEISFIIRTSESGINSGRPVVLRAKTSAEMHEWIDVLEGAVRAAYQKAHAHETSWYRWRKAARELYHSDRCQYAVGIVILGSYMMSIANAQILPPAGSQAHYDFFVLEIIFSAVFALELALNMFGTWYWDFVSDAWNIFDSVVVVVSIISLVEEGLPAVNVLRLFRVFKMVRLFKKLVALRILINALLSSIVPVLYSFVILLLVTSLYAIIATEVFGEQVK